ncbi:TRAP transporter small permease [Dongia deserti]|uniref:TRAP transporter small permease n=1 Tax=Dongia deserti TaxID=2268030 RepID=UPI000E64E181|nr:TRAP transporter small permease [Dongia deserti]
MRRIHAWLGKMEAILAGVLLILMVGLLFLGGFARMAHHPLNWTVDFATCFFAWACFLCADIAWRQGGLMSIDFAINRLPEKARRLVRYANYLLISGFLVYLAVAGTWLSYVSRARSFQGIPDISYSWVTMSLPVGACLLLITTILKFQDEVRGNPALAHA